MVGDVDDPGDLGHRIPNRHLNALAEGDRRHPAAGAASAQAEESGAILYGHQIGMTAMGGDARVDLPIEDLEQIPNLAEVERLLIAVAMNRNQNNKGRAAAALGISREGLRKRLLRETT